MAMAIKAEEEQLGIVTLKRKLRRLNQIGQAAHATDLTPPSPFAIPRADPSMPRWPWRAHMSTIGAWEECERGYPSVSAALRQYVLLEAGLGANTLHLFAIPIEDFIHASEEAPLLADRQGSFSFPFSSI